LNLLYSIFIHIIKVDQIKTTGTSFSNQVLLYLLVLFIITQMDDSMDEIDIQVSNQVGIHVKNFI